MASLKPVRGTHDILPDDNRRYRRIEETAYAVAERFGYGEITTPIFEFTDVFARTLGETSDIVTKEMYSFEDKGGDWVTLRPEGTAGVARALISNGLQQDLPLKLFYRGPMFRYERPQKGRWREFRQVGIELLGVPAAAADVEIISLADQFLGALGIADKVTLELNSLGDDDSRAAYRAKLVDYLTRHRDALSKDSLARLDRNPLRILDSKDEGDRQVLDGAPILVDSLNEPSRNFFDELRRGLDRLGIDFEINPRIVRGLDYYCHTAFEFTTTALGAQGTVLAGGRYDGLIAQMGGPATPGTGWAAGVERLALLVDGGVPRPRPIAVIPVGDAAADEAMAIADRLRRAGFAVELGFSGNLKRRMRRADSVDAAAAVLLGEDELAKGTVSVRDMETGEQTEVGMDALAHALQRYR